MQGTRVKGGTPLPAAYAGGVESSQQWDIWAENIPLYKVSTVLQVVSSCCPRLHPEGGVMSAYLFPYKKDTKRAITSRSYQ